MKQALKTLVVAAALSMAATSVQAALSVPAGNSLVVNDSSLNIAWTQDANLFKTQANSYAGGAAAFVTAVLNASGGTTPTYLIRWIPRLTAVVTTYQPAISIPALAI